MLAGRKIYTVSELNREVRALLETRFALLWLEGEVSNLSRPASGHLYFSLKDAAAQIRCALFRNRARLLGVALQAGQHVLVRARISLYEPRGDYQLIVEHLEDAGEGALRRAFEALKQRLDERGLFAVERKRRPPAFPKRVGVVTSPSAAALRDVLSVLKRRFPGLPVLIYPVPVQGEGAGEKIASAIGRADRRRECDVLLLVRGGGSLEDLWAFNEEVVAQAIYDCSIPVVCGVGHEIDFTIADLVADARASTPSAAAELISPDRAEWLAAFAHLQSRLQALLRRRLAEHQRGLERLAQNLARRHPGRRLQDRMQRLDELEQRLLRAQSRYLERYRTRAQGLASRLLARSPLGEIHHLQHRRGALTQRLALAIRRQLERSRQRFRASSRALHNTSPLQTLGRGYAILRDARSGGVIRRAEQAQIGQQVEALLGEGRLLCRVEGTAGKTPDR